MPLGTCQNTIFCIMTAGIYLHWLLPKLTTQVMTAPSSKEVMTVMTYVVPVCYSLRKHSLPPLERVESFLRVHGQLQVEWQKLQSTFNYRSLQTANKPSKKNQDVTGSAYEDRLFLIWLLTTYNPLTGAVQTYGKPMAGLVAGSITCLMLGISWVEGDQAVDSSDEKAYSGLYILVYHITLWYSIVYNII